MRKHYMKTNTGFTLVEMIVATAIFTIAMFIVVGSLIMLTNESRKARSIRVVSDNLAASIESMSRSMRMGSNFNCGCQLPLMTPTECSLQGSSGGACLAYVPQNAPASPTANDMTVFRYNATDKSIERSTTGIGGTFLRYTAPEIAINSLTFYVIGTTPGTDQPFITMLIKGRAGTKDNISTDYNIQTSVSARSANF